MGILEKKTKTPSAESRLGESGQDSQEGGVAIEGGRSVVQTASNAHSLERVNTIDVYGLKGFHLWHRRVHFAKIPELSILMM